MSVKYVCPFYDKIRGEVCDIVVELTQDEIDDCILHSREGRGPGVIPDGPLPRSYAWHRAVKEVPREFEPLFHQTHLVQ
jgi:hypothetical protein